MGVLKLVGVPFVAVLRARALVFGVHISASDFLKLLDMDDTES